ncbi:MAG: hypothetical protein AABX98_03705 [Nanoarchaeota archaeon]
MEIISKVSKGTKMDQIYIPKNRVGFDIGNYVKIVPVIKPKRLSFFYYNVLNIEPLKISVITEIVSIIEKHLQPENIIITGSFLDNGFLFDDIDILLITDQNEKEKIIKEKIESKVKVKIHFILMTNTIFNKKIKIDPILTMMLSKCITTTRLIPIKEREIIYHLLDLQLLSCETFPLNYDFYSGKEKYYYIRNMITIKVFLEGDKISKEEIDKRIEKDFKIKVEEIKQNIIEDKEAFIKIFKIIYQKTFNKIMGAIPKE